jgi:NADPH:quinone reductase-like Zn-dependent oxidoreductase
MTNMKAVIIRKYGGPEVLEIADVPAPPAKDDEVVIAVRASSVNPVDWLVRDGRATSFVKVTFPVILGCDLAGTVVEVGKHAKRFTVGDAVFAMMPQDWGAHAERVALSERLVQKKPAAITMEEAAALGTVSLTALKGLRKHAGVKAGQRIVINGGSSSVGMAAIQIAKALGAHVTAVCSAASFELVRGIGADELIDYKTKDFTTGDEKFDVVFDCVGSAPYGKCKRVLDGARVHVTTMPTVGTFLRQFLNPILGAKVFALLTTGDGDELAFIKSLVEAGKMKIVIDKVFPVADVAKAQEYSKAGRAKGKIVLQFPA